MSKPNIIRLGGITAIVAGILRVFTSLVPGTTARIMTLYLVTDLFLLFGSVGLYGFQEEEIGFSGTLGFLLQVAGILILIGRDLAISDDSIYPVGALIFAMGLDLFALGSWKVGKLSPWILLLWIRSTVLGPIGYFAHGLSVLFTVSGILFGIGFAAAGIMVLFSSTRLNPKPS